MHKPTPKPRSHHAAKPRGPAKIPYAREDRMTSYEREVNAREFGSYVSPMSGTPVQCRSRAIQSRIRGLALTDFGVNCQ
jgi:hypothetical protein